MKKRPSKCMCRALKEQVKEHVHRYHPECGKGNRRAKCKRHTSRCSFQLRQSRERSLTSAKGESDGNVAS